METPSPNSERRRAARAVADFPVRLANQPDHEPALLRDISEIGLACVAPAPIPELTRVALDFSLPGTAAVHHIQGAVVRCEPLPKARGKYDLAIFFTEVAPETKAALRAYVGSNLRASK